MSVKDDTIQPSSNSFWEINNYKRTVKRIENGNKLCDSLKDLIEQRSEIERSYAKQLFDWSKKWHKLLENGPEYGTLKAAWQGVLTEAEEVNRVHTAMADNVIQQVQGSIKQWQKDQYHKSLMSFPEVKEAEDNFKKAQKPWAKRYKKVMLSKQEYYTACKHEKSTAVQENNAKGDTSFSQDQLRKLTEKLEKCRRDVESTRKVYEASLQDLNGSNPKYIEDMTEVFNGCQEMEKKRLDFFKEMLFGIHKCMDLSNNSTYAQIYRDLHQTIANADAQQDLKWWSNCHGVGMPMDWPRFIEYTPEIHANISRRGKSELHAADGGGITITSIKHTSDYVPTTTDQSNHNRPPSYQQATSQSNRPQSYDQSMNPFSDTVEESTNAAGTPEPQNHIDAVINAELQQSTAPTTNDGGNPFGEGDDWDDDDNYLVDDGRPGVPVRSLYNYEAVESDELSFKAGDIFTKLDEPNEQGWCKGRMDGRVGLYPADYAAAI